MALPSLPLRVCTYIALLSGLAMGCSNWFNNLGTGSLNTGFPLGYQFGASPNVASGWATGSGSGYTFESASVYLQGNALVTVQLMTGTTSLPNTYVSTIATDYNVNVGATWTLFTFTAPGGSIALNPNTNYWIVLSSSGIAWRYTDVGTMVFPTAYTGASAPFPWYSGGTKLSLSITGCIPALSTTGITGALGLYAADRVDMFLRSNSGSIAQIMYTAGSYTFWDNVFPTSVPVYPATVLVTGTSRGSSLSVFGTMPNADISRQHYEPGYSWSGWNLIGYTTNLPAGVSSWGPGRIDLFVTGTNGNGVYHKWNTDAITDNWQWSGYTNWEAFYAPSGVTFISGPASVAWLGSGGSQHIRVFVVGSDRAIWFNYFEGSWSGWYSLGGFATSGPAAVLYTDPSTGARNIAVWVRNANTPFSLSRRVWVDGSNPVTGWAAWDSPGSTGSYITGTVYPAGTPCVVADSAKGWKLFVKGSNNIVYTTAGSDPWSVTNAAWVFNN